MLAGFLAVIDKHFIKCSLDVTSHEGEKMAIPDYHLGFTITRQAFNRNARRHDRRTMYRMTAIKMVGGQNVTVSANSQQGFPQAWATLRKKLNRHPDAVY